MAPNLTDGSPIRRAAALLLVLALGGPFGRPALAYVVDPSGSGDATTFQGGIDLVTAEGAAERSLTVLGGFYDEDVVIPLRTHLNGDL